MTATYCLRQMRASGRRLTWSRGDLPDEDGKPVCGISFGPVGLRMLKGFHQAVREFVQAGNPVIVDEMMLGPEVRDHWFTTLAGLDVVWVGVRCDLDELERREVERKGRVGLARWSEKRVHEGMAYDLSVETTGQAAEACADQIVAAVHGRSELDSKPAESTDRENSAGSLSDPVRGVRSRDEWRPEEGRRDEE